MLLNNEYSDSRNWTIYDNCDGESSRITKWGTKTEAYEALRNLHSDCCGNKSQLGAYSFSTTDLRGHIHLYEMDCR